MHKSEHGYTIKTDGIVSRHSRNDANKKSCKIYHGFDENGEFLETKSYCTCGVGHRTVCLCAHMTASLYILYHRLNNIPIPKQSARTSKYINIIDLFYYKEAWKALERDCDVNKAKRKRTRKSKSNKNQNHNASSSGNNHNHNSNNIDLLASTIFQPPIQNNSKTHSLCTSLSNNSCKTKAKVQTDAATTIPIAPKLTSTIPSIPPTNTRLSPVENNTVLCNSNNRTSCTTHNITSNIAPTTPPSFPCFRPQLLPPIPMLEKPTIANLASSVQIGDRQQINHKKRMRSSDANLNNMTVNNHHNKRRRLNS